MPGGLSDSYSDHKSDRKMINDGLRLAFDTGTVSHYHETRQYICIKDEFLYIYCACSLISDDPGDNDDDDGGVVKKN